MYTFDFIVFLTKQFNGQTVKLLTHFVIDKCVGISIEIIQISYIYSNFLKDFFISIISLNFIYSVLIT